MKYIGKSAPINDAQVKICGQVKFTGDMYLPGMLYAKIVKSTVANGLITGFDFHGADQLAGVVKIYTKSDCNLPKYNSYRTFPGQEFCPEDEELLTDHPRYAGDRVALVIATTAQIAAVAASMIEVQYERLPFAVSMVESLDPEMVAIHEDGNIVGEYRRSFGYG
ncbi:MAG: xanthine dehydrogenase family protein molybdopterin-binding subunit, partial [Clostridiales bacterium]